MRLGIEVRIPGHVEATRRCHVTTGWSTTVGVNWRRRLAGIWGLVAIMCAVFQVSEIVLQDEVIENVGVKRTSSTNSFVFCEMREFMANQDNEVSLEFC